MYFLSRSPAPGLHPLAGTPGIGQPGPAAVLALQSPVRGSDGFGLRAAAAPSVEPLCHRGHRRRSVSLLALSSRHLTPKMAGWSVLGSLAAGLAIYQDPYFAVLLVLVALAAPVSVHSCCCAPSLCYGHGVRPQGQLCGRWGWQF